MSELLRCENLSKTFEETAQSIQVLNNLSFNVNEGEHVAILGSSGSGKSTLLHILGALDSPSDGNVFFQGQNIFSWSSSKQAQFRNTSLGFVYQFHHLLPEFSALENAAMPLFIGKVAKAKALAQAAEMLDNVGLSHRLSHKPSKLSGGERQRVAIARALVNNPKLVLADEPTGNLDEETGASIFELINRLKAQMNTSFVIVTHDNTLARQLDRVLVLRQGSLLDNHETSSMNSTQRLNPGA